MKNRSFLLTIFALFLILGFSSCDPCKDVTCQNGGVCDEGDCICTDEYEGDNCETKKIAKFLGSYAVSKDCGSGPDSFTSNISEDPNVENGIIFSNFFDLVAAGADPAQGEVIKGTVNLETNVITIPAQTVFGIDFTATTGTFDGTSVSFTYDVLGGSSTCTEVHTKN